MICYIVRVRRISLMKNSEAGTDYCKGQHYIETFHLVQIVPNILQIEKFDNVTI